MLTIMVDGELEVRLRARANRAGRTPDNFALAAIEHSLEGDDDWSALQNALAQHGGKGILPAQLPDDPKQAQSQGLGAFASDPEWDEFLEAIARERERANSCEPE
jgi:predicted DNA-binding protein